MTRNYIRQPVGLDELSSLETLANAEEDSFFRRNPHLVEPYRSRLAPLHFAKRQRCNTLDTGMASMISICISSTDKTLRSRDSRGRSSVSGLRSGLFITFRWTSFEQCYPGGCMPGSRLDLLKSCGPFSASTRPLMPGILRRRRSLGVPRTSFSVLSFGLTQLSNQGMETDALQLTLRFSFRARLMPGVRLP
jgi:hypothetical protein